MSEFRGFIAVEIPISERLQALHSALDRLPIKMKLVSLENIHITLKFLGDIEEKTSVKNTWDVFQ